MPDWVIDWLIDWLIDWFVCASVVLVDRDETAIAYLSYSWHQAQKSAYGSLDYSLHHLKMTEVYAS